MLRGKTTIAQVTWLFSGPARIPLHYDSHCQQQGENETHFYSGVMNLNFLNQKAEDHKT